MPHYLKEIWTKSRKSDIITKREVGKSKKRKAPPPPKGRILKGLCFHEDRRVPGQMADAAAGAEVKIRAEYFTQTDCGYELLGGL